MIIQSPSSIKMASTASVQSWLGQELETRGVDAVVYTRYILSIFQQDSFDLEQDPELMAGQSSLPSARPHTHYHPKGSMGHVGGSSGSNSSNHRHQTASTRREKGKGRGKARNHIRWQSPEDLRKDAVVKCLQSVTEKDCGIEGLVEELCLKLKKVQEEREENTSPSHSPDHSNTPNSDDPADEKERYYEAFPSLSDKTELAAADVKPKGAWKLKPKRNNSTGSISANPCISHDLDSLPKKSFSASVSRSSSSPVAFQERHYQRAQSLPNNLSRNRVKSPTFVVPKYQGRKGHRYNQSHEKGSKRHNREREFSSRGGERGDGRYARKKGNVFPEWYSESGEGLADMSHWDGKEAGLTDDPNRAVLTMEAKENTDKAVIEEEKLDEAVSTMVETLCRSIMEECDDDQPFVKGSPNGPEQLADDSERCLFERHNSLKDWRAGSTRIADTDYEASMAPTTVEGQLHPSSSIWEKNLVPGSPLCIGHQEPWGDDARSCLPTATSITGTNSAIEASACQLASGQTSPQSLLEDSAADEASDTTSLAEELRVDINHHQMDSAPISPRNAPIGTGRNTDSLLRICDHTHAHSHPFNIHGPPGQAGSTWGLPSDSSQSVQPCTPVMSGLPSDHSVSADEDSLVQGICSSHKDSSLLNMSEAHSLDMNNAMWATYETKQPQVNPPKIVTWDDSIFSGFQPMAKVSAFIEGGVYGSPYSSHNNSQFNSCSTSPCNDSSIRELWESTQSRGEGAQSREASSVCSLECLLSPQPCGGASCCSIQDEQSIIEDSLVDSPKYLCSRSSSRFEFARSISDIENSGNSSPRGTETDEMISEDEWVEEVPRDGHETSLADLKGKLSEHCDMDRTPQDKCSGVSSGSMNSQHGSSANSQQGLCHSLLASGKGTVVTQHLLSADWKRTDATFSEPIQDPHPQSWSSAMPAGSSRQHLISSSSHFKPIQQGFTSSSPLTAQTFEDASETQSSVEYQQLVARSKTAQHQGPLRQGAKVSDTSRIVLPGYTAFESGTNAMYPNAYSSSNPVQHSYYSHGPGGGAGPGIGDPGGGSGCMGDSWGYFGFKSGQHLDPDMSKFVEDDDVFLHEGLLVDQPLEIHPHRLQGQHKKRGQTNNVCKEFLSGQCNNSMCGFSHVDPGHVTCGQWLEGRCQRGSLCQFMHGYTSDVSSQCSSRAESRTGSATPDESEEISWDQQRGRVPDLLMLSGYQGADGGLRAPSNQREGGTEHIRSQPIKISSKTR
ncbi:uncharacterized protein [Diadema setosum]|uniref:uncharacterized protein n=1 Tax=Diadema setosum TaxID=31175 RepID=UPI003B3ADE23